ncbi:hypothetical protein Tco_0097848 [Tanacetum coccineum]
MILKRHYGFKPGLLGKSVSLGVDISNWEMFDDDWGLESKEVSPLGEELSLFDRPNEVERGINGYVYFTLITFPLNINNILDDPLMPDLEDTAKVQNTSIFGSAFDDEDLYTYNFPFVDQVMGAEADFNNMEPSTVVSPIPTTRIHSIHPKDQIIGVFSHDKYIK